MKNIKNKNLKKGGNTRLKIFLTIFITGFLLLAGSYPVGAATYNFNPITFNSNEPEAVGNSIFMEVTESSENVSFKFTNNYYWESDPNIPSVITQIYFYDFTNGDELLAYSSLNSSEDGVSFDLGSGNVPGWETVFPYGTTSDFAFGADPPPTTNGINNFYYSGDWLKITFSGSFSDVIDALNTGQLVVGLHVQSLPLDGTEDFYEASDGFINQVPIPAAAWMFGAGVLGLVGIRRKLRS